MRSATLFCALCATSLVSARTVWGNYRLLAGTVEKTDTITDTTCTTNTDTTTEAIDNTTVITTTTDTTTSTTTSDALGLTVKEIKASFDNVEITPDVIAALFGIDIELSPHAAAVADAIEEVLRSASTIVGVTNNATAIDPIASGTIIITSTEEPTGIDVTVVGGIEVAIGDCAEGAATTSPTIIDDGTDLAIMSETPPNAPVTAGGGASANGTIIVEDPGGTHVTVTPGTKAGGTAARGACGAGRAGTRSSVTGAGGTKTGTGPRGRFARTRGTKSGGAGVGRSGSTGTRGGVARIGDTGSGGTGTARGTRTRGGVTTLTTATRISSIAFPTETTGGFGSFRSDLAGEIPQHPHDISVFERCMGSAGTCFRAARRGTVPSSQCEALKASCRGLSDRDPP